MCRILGVKLHPNSKANIETFRVSRDSMSYGGPDASGEYLDENIYLGHRRLRVLDLDSRADQPMIYEDLVVLLNGEIYNHHTIRSELEEKGYYFETHSDTEVVLKAWHLWGPESIKKFNGMFIIVIHNKKTHSTNIIRDRIGIKPLYIYKNLNNVAFSSELKGLMHLDFFSKSINVQAIKEYFSQRYLSNETCIFKNVTKVAPASITTISPDNEISSRIYWAVPSHEPNVHMDLPTAKSEFVDLFSHSLERRTLSDVPIGLFLSGGVDSGLVASVAAKELGIRLNSFSLSLEDNVNNEAQKAKAVSNYLDIPFQEVSFSRDDFESNLQVWSNYFDEPFACASALPFSLLAKQAKNYFTVAFSGDGGDELFGGYVKYQAFVKWRTNFGMPQQLRAATQKVIQGSSKIIKKFIGNKYSNFDSKWNKLENLAAARSESAAWNSMKSNYSLSQLQPLFKNYSSFENEVEIGESIFDMGMEDLRVYLEGELLTKSDRACMQHAVECRVPFLDHELLEWSASLPDKFRISQGTNKYLLRSVLSDYLPNQLINIQKRGFTIPIEKWIYDFGIVKQMLNSSEFFDEYGLSLSYAKILYSNKNYANGQLLWAIVVLYLWDKKWCN